MARVRYLTQVIWGPGYRVAVETVTGEADTRPPEEIACWEAGLLAAAWCWFAGIRPGDDAAIVAVLAGTTRSTLIIRRSRWTSSRP